MSLSPSYFDQLYTASPDPWSLASRWYEQRKYAITMASLTRERYRRGFEPGCSVGVLTALLAGRCDSLLATDVAPQAVSATRERVSSCDGVEVQQLAVPASWPDGTFDLIVVSELGYYLSSDALAELVDRAAGSLSDDGDLVVAHWRHSVPDYPLTGDTVHEAFRSDERLAPLAEHVEADFRLDVLVRRGRASVAADEGLV